jgi:hypothetical protein
VKVIEKEAATSKVPVFKDLEFGALFKFISPSSLNREAVYMKGSSDGITSKPAVIIASNGSICQFNPGWLDEPVRKLSGAFREE